MIEQFIQNNPINFLPYTIAPADSKDNELESFEAAIEYYNSKGVTDLVMQEKRMGSNVCMYLFNDSSRDFISTKTGYCRKDNITNAWRDKVFELFPHSRLVILQGELEPWSYFGNNLIDNTFYKYYFSQKAHNDLEDEATYERVINLYKQSLSLGITKDINKKKFLKENPNINNRQLESLINVLDMGPYYLDKATKQELNSRFKAQLDLYSRNTEPLFIPFSILKVDDKVIPCDNYTSWKLFNTEGCAAIPSKELYLDWLANNPNLEGVVIKPRDPHLTDVVPAIKVRNKEFLRLIYGSYYDRQLKEYLQTKSCKGKRRASIRQWQLSYLMLQVPYEKIYSEQFYDLVKKFFNEDKKCRNLDSRL